MTTTIHVTGYPRSGTTWLSRLLADIYNCPLGGSIPAHDGRELASFGWDRESDFIVRKGHYMPVVRPFDAKLEAHKLNVNSLEDRRVVHIVRHPFDVAVSASQYHRKSIMVTLERMARGKSYNLPSWQDYVSTWYSQPVRTVFIKYEDLLNCPANEYAPLTNLVLELGYDVPHERLVKVYQARTFLKQHEADIRSGNNDIRRILDEGVAGRWREKMNKQEIKFGIFYFGDVMEGLGYDDH